VFHFKGFVVLALVKGFVVLALAITFPRLALLPFTEQKLSTKIKYFAYIKASF